jgi:hypothetical protein
VCSSLTVRKSSSSSQSLTKDRRPPSSLTQNTLRKIENLIGLGSTLRRKLSIYSCLSESATPLTSITL